VLRHTVDDLSRPKHGVFDGGRAGALQIVDEAWLAIQQQGVQPVFRGSRASYTVDMGRRVGYFGGTVGSAAGNPALNRVLIVVEKGTTNVVTSFPVQ
jgi:hypothetical protein